MHVHCWEKDKQDRANISCSLRDNHCTKYLGGTKTLFCETSENTHGIITTSWEWRKQFSIQHQSTPTSTESILFHYHMWDQGGLSKSTTFASQLQNPPCFALLFLLTARQAVLPEQTHHHSTAAWQAAQPWPETASSLLPLAPGFGGSLLSQTRSYFPQIWCHITSCTLPGTAIPGQVRQSPLHTVPTQLGTRPSSDLQWHREGEEMQYLHPLCMLPSFPLGTKAFCKQGLAGCR